MGTLVLSSKLFFCPSGPLITNFVKIYSKIVGVFKKILNKMTFISVLLFFLLGKKKGKVPAIEVLNIQNINHSNYIHLSGDK